MNPDAPDHTDRSTEPAAPAKLSTGGQSGKPGKRPASERPHAHKPLATRNPLPAFLAALALLLSSALLLSACGGASSSSGSKASTASSSTTATNPSTTPTSTDAANTPAPSIAPDTTVATIAGKPITWGQLRHQMAIGPAKREVPEPPSFTACVAQRHSKSPSSSAEALKGECQKLYQEELSSALSTLIHNRWLLAEAAQRGVKLDQAAVKRELQENTQPELRALAAKQGQTRADIRQNIVLQNISDVFYAEVKRKTPRLTPSFLAHYYATHKKDFAVPEQRDLHILRTASQAAAQKARKQIEAGTSFQSLADASSLPQPVQTEHGFLKDLTPGFFSEPVLSEAIFRARPHVLSGPVHISIGNYLFEVTHVTPAHQETLAQAKGRLLKELPEELHKKVLAQATKAFKLKWVAKTDCLPGFVVPNCKQAGGAGSAAVEDIYTF